MNNAQITGMRDLYAGTKNVVREKYTAKEMALISHNLSKGGDMATTLDGKKYIWDKRFQHWARWK